MITYKRIFAIGFLTLLSAASQSAFAMLPNCQSASSDSDGDGYGWENNASCLVVASSASNSSSNQSAPTQSASRFATCASAATDPDGDGFGFENGQSCLVNAASSPASSSPASSGPASSGPASSGQSSSNAAPRFATCASAATDPDGDGFGFENGRSCRVAAGSGAGIMSNDAPGTAPGNNATTPVSSGPVGSAVAGVSRLALVGTKSVTTTSTSGDNFATEQVGNFMVMQNAWNAGAAFPGYAWSQTINTNTNGAPISWSYDWGPGIPGSNGRASSDFNVRSYPEVIFGIKDEFRTSAPKAVIGFPVRVDSMPTVSIDYAFNAPQFGTARTVDASVTNRFPNGSTIQGERNVAAESFLYEPTNGVCDDNLVVDRSSGSNHAFEVMVWLDSGAERLPSGSRDYVTTISLRGASYDVYTKSNDIRYIAFVATNPQSTGTIVWNDYMDWARLNAHRVEERFGANSNALQIEDSWCVANILVGTEIFWGAGSFDLLEWTITQSE